MSAEDVYVYSGLQLAVVYELNDKGRPKAVDTTAYTGLEVYATKEYTPSLPKPAKVPHTGNDQLLKTQIFPGKEPATADFQVGAEDLDLLAKLAGTTIKEEAGLKMLPHLHDLQGKEKSVMVILAQAALSKIMSAQGYHFHMITSSKMVATLPGAGESPLPLVFDMTINPSRRYPWGANIAPLADIYDPLSGVPDMGVFAQGVLSGFSEYQPRIASFISGPSTTVFEFPPSMQAVSTDKISVFTAAPTDDYSEKISAGITKATTGVTFGVSPGDGVEVHILFQKA